MIDPTEASPSLVAGVGVGAGIAAGAGAAAAVAAGGAGAATSAAAASATLAQLRASALQTSDSILARDLAERRRIEEHRNLLASIVESSDDAIIATDLDGVITSWNHAAEALYGYAAADVIGRWITILFPPGHDDQEIAMLARRGEARLRQHFETQRLRKDGSVIDVAVTISPVMSPDGRVVGTSKIVRDITDRRQAALRLERSNRALEQFAYVASHDLQAPLRSICGFAQLMKRQYGDCLDAQAGEYLHHMVTSAQQMQDLILGLLEFSRVGGSEAELVPVDSLSVLRTALGQLHAALEECGGVVDHGPLPTVLGCELELVQLFQNLLSNALKFRRNDVQTRVAVSARRTPLGWEFAVADQGIGIDPAHHGRLFKMFQRLHTRDAYEGTGIGLAVCQKIVHRHGGQIRVESQPGRGSTFFFSLRAG